MYFDIRRLRGVGCVRQLRRYVGCLMLGKCVGRVDDTTCCCGVFAEGNSRRVMASQKLWEWSRRAGDWSAACCRVLRALCWLGGKGSACCRASGLELIQITC